MELVGNSYGFRTSLGRGVMMKKIAKAAMLVSVLAMVGCSGVGASDQNEIASDVWVTEQVNQVSASASSLEERAAKLDREIKALQAENGVTPTPIQVRSIFTDISRDYFAYEEIYFLNQRDVIRGYPDGTFAPNQTITRAQTASMLVRELGLTAPASYQMQATDVSAQHQSYEQLRIVEYHGLMAGNEGKMLPGEGLKRSQMAVILSRAFDLAEPNQQYSFTDITSSYPNFEQINTIAHNGITTEVGGAFRPNETTTRAQFSLFLARAIHEPFRP